MIVSEADAYRIRAMAAELTALKLQVQIAAKELADAFATLGLDPATHGIVSRENAGHPVGTVLDATTGQPLATPEPGAPYMSRAPKVKAAGDRPAAGAALPSSGDLAGGVDPPSGEVPTLPGAGHPVQAALSQES